MKGYSRRWYFSILDRTKQGTGVPWKVYVTDGDASSTTIMSIQQTLRPSALRAATDNVHSQMYGCVWRHKVNSDFSFFYFYKLRKPFFFYKSSRVATKSYSYTTCIVIRKISETFCLVFTISFYSEDERALKQMKQNKEGNVLAFPYLPYHLK